MFILSCRQNFISSKDFHLGSRLSPLPREYLWEYKKAIAKTIIIRKNVVSFTFGEILGRAKRTISSPLVRK